MSEPKNVQIPDYFKIISSLILIRLVFLACIWIGDAFAKSVSSFDPEWLEYLNWLKTYSSATSYYLEPSQTPKYRILRWWDYGNWIVYLSERPAVSNSFQTGVEDFAHIFMTDAKQEAKAIMDKLRVKYVITDFLMANGKFGAIAQLAGKNMGDYYYTKTINGNAGTQTFATAKKEFSNLEFYKLHKLDGSNLGNLELAHESNVPGMAYNQINIVKVFKYVPGAKLSGTVNPNQPVVVMLCLKSNIGRKFIYQNKALADKNGSFEITVPYSTENMGNGVSAISAYSLNAEGNTHRKRNSGKEK